MVKDKKIVINVDFATLQYDEQSTKKFLKYLRNQRRKADWLKRTIIVQTKNIEQDDPHKIADLMKYNSYVAVNAIQIENKAKRLEYLYDEICFYLDHACQDKNLCDFKNDKCFAKRDTDVTMGCCHHYPDKRWGLLYQKEMIPCEYLGEKGCTTQAIGCKLFMCDEVNKKGYKYTVYNVLLIRYFFNFMQKILSKMSVFDSKENIMKRLLKYNF